LTVVNLPVSLCYGVATVAIPSVSASKTEEQKLHRAKRTISLTLLFSLPCAVFCFFFSPFIINLLFKGLSSEEKGIAISATDLTADSIELAVKLVEKTKLDFLTLVFGEAREQTLIEKMSAVNSVKHSKKIKVLGNVETAGAMIELYRLNTDVILTPYADDIGKELVDRFKIKSLKLV
jgi:hypothetical protein